MLRLRVLLLSSVLLLSFGSARAEWQFDGSLLGGRGAAYPSGIASDGAGGAIIVWVELRASDYDLYARRIDGAGNVMWTTDGVAICTATADQQDAHIIPDGAGGAIIAWRDSRNGTEDIYAQRVNANGAVIWTPGGVAICNAVNTQAAPTLVSDGASGAIIAWQDARSGTNWDIYARRVNSAGVPQWTANGTPVCTLASGQTGPELVIDGAGGVFVAWLDARNGNGDLFAQHLTTGGVSTWTPNGLSVCSAAGNQGTMAVVSDGAGGMLLAWRDDRFDIDIFAQRLNNVGSPQWELDGEVVCDAVDEQGSPAVTTDGAGGMIVAWIDYRTGTNLDIYAQRMTAFGVPVWTDNGVALCTATDQQDQISLVSDGAGGAIALWSDRRTGTESDIFGRRVNAGGLALWEYDGVPVCTAFSSQGLPLAVSDGAGGAIVGWGDSRSGFTFPYAQRVEFRYGFWGRPEPTIRPAVDNPSDQGGHVIVRWTASQRDLYYAPLISFYSVWRSTDVIAFTAGMEAGAKHAGDARAVSREHAGTAVWKEETLAGPVYWEWVSNVGATYLPSYSYTSPTRQDSTAGDAAVNHFKVLAHESGGRIWESATSSASSVDNIAPSAPLLLAIQASGQNVVLTWKPVDDLDFATYSLYRKGSNGVQPVPVNFLTDRTLPTYTDVGAAPGGYYYIVTAKDTHGNQSAPSNEVSLLGSTGVDDTPAVTAFTVRPNFPNPFSARTDLNLGLPSASEVSLEVFDIAGRRVLSRSLGQLKKGWQRIAFDATDAGGSPLASGVYFYRVNSGGKSITNKMVIAR